MAYSADSFVADEQPTTAKWNKLWSNDASFNDGTGIADNAILARHRSQVAKAGVFTPTGTGNQSITGVGFRPRAVFFNGVSNNSNIGSSTTAAFSTGFMDSSGNQYAANSANRNGHGGGNEIATNRALINYTIAGGGGSKNLGIDFNYVSMDSDGFTINLVTNLATSNIGYLAIA